MIWKAFHASVIGTSHVDRQLPCQDACDAWVSESGATFIAAVADGAGSASRSERGASQCVSAVMQDLKAFFQTADAEIAPLDPVEESKSQLLEVLARVREKLINAAADLEVDPSELACTLVGVVAVLPGRGFLFHIGDGAGIVQFVDAAVPAVVSHPENGEYSNETWFITHESWKDHVRVTPFDGAVETIGIMSDGAMPFTLARDRNSLFSGFITPIAKYLRDRSVEEGNNGLRSILGSERTNSITNDDKTLVLGFTHEVT